MVIEEIAEQALLDEEEEKAALQQEMENLPHTVAKPSCIHCHGTGIAGKLLDIGDAKQWTREAIKKADRLPITCSCVRRATLEKVPWLQRHGIDKQPWLQS